MAEEGANDDDDDDGTTGGVQTGSQTSDCSAVRPACSDRRRESRTLLLLHDGRRAKHDNFVERSDAFFFQHKAD